MSAGKAAFSLQLRCPVWILKQYGNIHQVNVPSLLITISFCLRAHTDVCGLDFEKKSPSSVSMHVSLNKSAERCLWFEQGWVLHIKRKKGGCSSE